MKFVKDCIYRFIEIPNFLIPFVDAPEFQRLRNIKQLGLVHYVYPSAVHTRFEHSLGVMHLAGLVIEQLKNTGVVISNREKNLVQIAALYHDIGHVAFSHLFDYILEENKVGEPHEKRSVKALNIVNDRLGLLSSTEVIAVSKMINGEFAGTDRPFLYEIVSNAMCGMDVDRFDYLQRDAYHTGIPGFQPDYLVKCMTVERGRLAFKKKAMSEIKLLYQTRSRLFELIYRHPAVMKIERVIRKVITQLNIVENWETVDWLMLDDHDLMYLMKRNDLFKSQITTRGWDKTPGEDIFKHCKDLTADEIANAIDRVVLV